MQQGAEDKRKTERPGKRKPGQSGKRQEGSAFVEAALSVPFLILAIFFLAFLIRIDAAEEADMAALSGKVMETMISDSSSVTISIPVPFFQRTITIRNRLLTHPFTGENAKSEGLGTEYLETEDETVWVFPKRGEVYHSADCRIVKVYPFERLKTASVVKKYDPCSSCHPENAENGTPVYIFPSGTVYHLKSCSQVTRYVTELTKEQAVEQGYTPCSYCQK